MPQIEQLPLVYSSQWFWLLITLATIYFLVGRGIVPKVERTVDDRNQRIAADLAAAERARAEADETEEAYRLRMDESRGGAMKLTAKAKAEGARSTEARLAKADAAIQAKAVDAQARIRASREAAVKELEQVAGELARDIAGKVGGVSVSTDDAARAVKAVMANV
jgi:F-type H+-transporting ATPase subunit b